MEEACELLRPPAELLQLVEHPCLPLPLKALSGEGRQRLATLINELDLT